MKKILIGLMLLLVSSAAFADTLTVIKGDVYCRYKDMRMSHIFNTSHIKDNEYLITEYGLYYRVDGKLYLTTMFEIEFD